MDETLKNILLGIITGDALGSAFEGLGPGHIRARFKEITGYVDPAPALKGKMEHWKKPGFYSSISQFAFMAAATLGKARWHESFCGHIASSPEVNGNQWGIFRYPDSVEKKFISGLKKPEPGMAIPAQPSVRVISSCASLSGGPGTVLEHALGVISYVRLFTSDLSTAACAVSVSSLLRHLTDNRPSSVDYIGTCRENNSLLMDEINSNPRAIFNASLNPDVFTRELEELNEILSRLSGIRDKTEAEAMICSFLNRRLTTPIKRAAINIPAAIVPYALYLCSRQGQEPDGMFHTAMEGGQAAALTAMTAALRACVYGAGVIPDALIQNLANRKKIISFIDSLGSGARSSAMIETFIHTEAPLTAKAQEELAAKLKHIKKKQKDTISRADREAKLSQFVVESWTKIDKAKWKKERKKMDKKKNV
jgi:hypothetical protein